MEADASQGTVSPTGSTITWAPGDVAAGAKAQAWVHFTVDQSALTDTVSPESVVNKASTQTHSVVVQDPVCNVELVKTASVSTVKSGDTITYTRTVTNKGTTPNRYWVKDYVPDNTAFVSCDSAGTYGSSGSSKGYVNWFFESLAPGDVKTMTFTVKVGDCESGTVIPNVALSQITTTTVTPDFSTDPTGGKSNQVETTVTSLLPKTGDDPSLLLLTALGLIGIALCLFIRRQSQRGTGR